MPFPAATAPPGMKHCHGCNAPKELAAFSPKGRYCRPCTRELNVFYRLKRAARATK